MRDQLLGRAGEAIVKAINEHTDELKMAAEALLQVSASMPGQEPRTVVRTVATATARPEANTDVAARSDNPRMMESNPHLQTPPVMNIGSP